MSIFYLVDDTSAFLDGFGESITYTAKNSAARTITAIVDRDPPAFTTQGVVQPAAITIANDSTTGVAAEDIDTQADTFTFARRAGGSETRVYRIAAIVSQDAAMIRLALK